MPSILITGSNRGLGLEWVRQYAPGGWRVFVRPLHPKAQAHLSRPRLDPAYCRGAPTIILSAEQMRALPECFADIPDPHRGQGRRHPLPVVLAIAAAATLCGMRGYKAISLWAKDLGQKARARFRCCYRNRRYEVPCRTVIREVLTGVDPEQLDRALQAWNARYADAGEALALVCRHDQ
jgi:NAD(P)-dependent dehydrogenase (short-subunit alcohol dehydrogenase family)